MNENENPSTGEIVDITPLAQHGNSASSLYNKINDPLVAIEKMGEMIFASGMFGCVKPEQGMVLAMQCLAEGKAPLELAKTYHIVEGKLSMRADAMLGRFLEKGGQVEWVRRDNEAVEAKWTFGKSKDISIGCTLEEMKANGVAVDKTGRNLKQNWAKFPRQMLTARSISEAVRLLAPQLIAGVYTPEEVSDFSSAPVALPSHDTVAPKVRYAEAKPTVGDEPVIDPKAKLQSRLDELLSFYEPAATIELVRLGYIKDGQTYKDLDAMSAQRLLDNPAKFVSRFNGTNA
jgi:hypothetical protein